MINSKGLNRIERIVFDTPLTSKPINVIFLITKIWNSLASRISMIVDMRAMVEQNVVGMNVL